MKKKNNYIWGALPEEEGKGEETPKGRPICVTTERMPSFVETVRNRIYFYSLIDKERILRLNREIRDMGIDLYRAALEQEREPAKIFLHIQSFGGSFFAGMSGMDEIIKSRVPVYTIVDGCCASAATFLSVCGAKRFINKHAYMLIHQLGASFFGKYEEFKDEMRNLDKIMEMIKKVYKEYTNIPVKKLNEILKHDLWFDAGECLKYGLVDEIIT